MIIREDEYGIYEQSGDTMTYKAKGYWEGIVFGKDGSVADYGRWVPFEKEPHPESPPDD